MRKGIMMRCAAALLVASFVALPATVAAQERFTAEIHGGVAFPTRRFGDLELKTGYTPGASLAFRLSTHAHLYAGWDYANFGIEDAANGQDGDFNETGYALGLRFEHPFRGDQGGVSYRLQAGATYKHIEAEEADGEIIAQTDHTWGFEGAAGLLFPMSGGTWHIAPIVRYRSLSTSFESAASGNVKLQYLSFDLGFGWRF